MLNPGIWTFLVFLLWLSQTFHIVLSQTLPEEIIDQKYEEAKLEIICESISFLMKRYENNTSQNPPSIFCSNLDAIVESIPADFQSAKSFFKLLSPKTYKSYGKNKLNQRLSKLISDIQTELNKLYQDVNWKSDVQVLSFRLKEIKDEQLKSKQPSTPKTQAPDNQTINQQNNSTSKSDSAMPIVYFILLVLIGCISFLVWQNQKLKQQIEEIDQNFQERYSRVDNRIDTMTSVKDFQALLLKFNFLNEQLNALMQEVVVLKNRNEHKITAEELYAKRTEHLEQYAYNPTVQIYYAILEPSLGIFNFEQFKTEPDKQHIYKIEINLEDQTQALFSIIQRNEYHQAALLNASNMLLPACEYTNEPYNDSRIITIEHGIAEKREQIWVIIKKAKIAFE